MDLLTTLLLCAVFLSTLALVGFIYLSVFETQVVDRRRVKKRLSYLSAGGLHGKEKFSRFRDKMLKEANPLERLLYKLPRVSRLDRMLLKAGLPLNASSFIAGSLLLGGCCLLLGYQLSPSPAPTLALLAGAVGLALPTLVLHQREKAYGEKFQEQLPEALELMARALKTGHALTSAMEMVGSEMEAPIKAEFSATVDEINLGLTFNEALENFCQRVPSVDLRLFAVSVIIQKETGGNIAELFERIARLIRDRVQFGRQVRTLTAEGRLSGHILVAIPVALFAYNYFTNFDYVSLLWIDPLGRLMLAAAVAMQIMGLVVIRKMVRIEL